MQAKFVIAAEDDEFCQMTISAMLKSLKVDFKVVPNGEEAVKLQQSKAPGVSLILMDIQMPVTDGLKATKQIRAFEKTKKLNPCKIIGLSADDDPKTKKDAIDSGMNDIAKKPLSKASLSKLV